MVLLLASMGMVQLQAQIQIDNGWFLSGEDEPYTEPAPDTNCVLISEFTNFKADMERICNISVYGSGGNWYATCSSRPFTTEDVGKVLVVKNGRSYAAYRRAAVTLNATITGITGNVATIVSYDADGIPTTVTGACGWVATDNFDAMQQAIDSAIARGKPRLRLNFTGTAYNVPARSSRPFLETRRKGWRITSNIAIIGSSRNNCRLKFGREDIMRIDHKNLQSYSAFWIETAALTVKHLTIESADRTTTAVDCQNISVFHLKNFSGSQDLMVDSVNVVTLDGKGFDGWGDICYANIIQPSSPTDTALVAFKNCFLMGQGGVSAKGTKTDPIATVPFDTLNRLLRIHNCVIMGGSATTRKYSNCFKIRIGSDTIISSNPEFSWYDYIDYERSGSNTRAPIFALFYPNNNSLRFWSRVVNVLNDSTALVKVSPYPPYSNPIDPGNVMLDSAVISTPQYYVQPSTLYYQPPSFSSDSCTFFSVKYNFHWAAFHSTYIGGNLGVDFQNSTFQPLRQSRNTGGFNATYDRSCININSNRIGLDVAAYYPDAGELQILFQGYGAGHTSSAQEFFLAPPQKN